MLISAIKRLFIAEPSLFGVMVDKNGRPLRMQKITVIYMTNDNRPNAIYKTWTVAAKTVLPTCDTYCHACWMKQIIFERIEALERVATAEMNESRYNLEAYNHKGPAFLTKPSNKTV